MLQTVSAVFSNPEAAERAIGALEDHGIGRDQISVATGEGGAAAYAADTPLTGPLAAQTRADEDEFLEVQTQELSTPTDMNAATDARLGGSDSTVSVVEAEGKQGITTTTPADAAKGAVDGSVVGLGLGLLAGAAALTLPGVGLVLAIGPLWTALAGALGATAAGAVAGGVTGYLRDMGVPESAAHQYAHALGTGSILISVRTSNTETAQSVLAKYGATGIATH